MRRHRVYATFFLILAIANLLIGEDAGFWGCLAISTIYVVGDDILKCIEECSAK